MLSKQRIDFLKQLARGLAMQFGPDCEITVHDLTQGTENTVIAIENGHVTGRQVGDGASEAVLQAIRTKKAQDNLCYLTRTPDGRVLRSSTLYIRDGDENPAALFAINYDITELTRANSILTQFVSPRQGGDKTQENVDTIFSNVNDLLDRLIEESYAYINKPVAVMTKEDKVKAIHFLDEKGAFLIKKSGDKIAKFYDISKYTLYNYMDQKPEQ